MTQDFSNDDLVKALRRPMATDHELAAAKRIEAQAALIKELVEALEQVTAWKDAAEICAPELGAMHRAMFRGCVALAKAREAIG